jgi:hypothetical protein
MIVQQEDPDPDSFFFGRVVWRWSRIVSGHRRRVFHLPRCFTEICPTAEEKVPWGPTPLVPREGMGDGEVMENPHLSPASLASSGESRCLYVHDFVRIDLPFDAVVGAFTHFVTSDLMQQLVADAWICESSELRQVMAMATTDESRSDVAVTIGNRRARHDALILPLSWITLSDRWIPPLDADLEIAGFGPARTHLHVLGQSRLRPQTPLYTERASLEHRLVVAVVRHFLRSLADVISSNADSNPTM